MVDTGDDGAGGATGQRDIAAQPVIDAFGGIRPMATKLGVPVSTVQGWKQRDTIPASRVPSIAAAARAHGVAMPTELQAAPVQPTAVPGAGPGDARRQVERRSAGPRPGIRFSRPEDWEPAQQPSRPTPAAADPTPVERTPAAATTTASAPATGTGAGAGRATGALVLAALALVAAVLWPILFSTWFGADAQEDSAGSEDALAQRVSVLEQAMAAGPDDGLQAAVSTLQADLEALKSAGDGSSEALDGIAARLDALEQAAGAPGQPDAAVGAALDSLERLVQSLDSAISGLEGRLAAVEAEVGRLEAAGDAAAVDRLQTAVAAVQVTLSQVQSDLSQVSDLAAMAREEAVGEATALVDSEIARLDRRIAALAGVDDAAAAHQGFLIALGQLEAQLQAARPFADQLAVLRQVSSGSETLAPLAPVVDEAFAPIAEAAEAGVPTPVGLRARFDDARRAVLAATDTPPQDTLDEIWGEISGLVTVSRVDGADAGTVDGVLATAEAHLAAGDVASAADAMEGLGALGDGFAAAAADWIAAARLRVAADAGVETVRQAALATFRPQGPVADEPPAAEERVPVPPADDSAASSTEPVPAEEGGDAAR